MSGLSSHNSPEPTLARQTRHLTALALLSLLCASCAAFLANTDVALVSLRPVSVQGSGSQIEARFSVLNHNSTPSRMVGILYRMDVRGADGRWVEAAEGYSVQDVNLPSGQPAEVSFTLDGLVDADVSTALDEDRYRLVGELRVMGGLGEVQVPFSFPSDGEESSGPSDSSPGQAL